MSTRYTVHINEYAQRHFIKSFAKKYLNKWDITLRAIILELENVEELSDTNFFEKINIYADCYIAKGEFKIAGTKESKKSSGCRYIVKVNTKENVAEILLIYNKNDVNMSNETVWWQKQIENIF
jgi:hypothetical protein